MVRQPLTPEQIEAGRRLGALLRHARAGRDLADVAHAAGISPETLRKIETGRLPSPGFGTIICLAEALDHQIEWGVWGGMTERERRALLRRRPGASWRTILETARRAEHKPSVLA